MPKLEQQGGAATKGMRNVEEIQRAHDMLVGIILDPELFESLYGQSSDLPLIHAADVLCWVLNHDHNVSFANNLAHIEKKCKMLGIEIRPCQ